MVLGLTVTSGPSIDQQKNPWGSTLVLMYYVANWPTFTLLVISLSSALKEPANLLAYVLLPVSLGLALAAMIVKTVRSKRPQES